MNRVSTQKNHKNPRNRIQSRTACKIEAQNTTQFEQKKLFKRRKMTVKEDLKIQVTNDGKKINHDTTTNEQHLRKEGRMPVI